MLGIEGRISHNEKPIRQF